MKSKINIIHIYYGSQGAGGLYIDEIFGALKKGGFTQQVFVSYYYPFKYGKRIFFKFTDLASGVKNYTGRKYFRALEMLFGFGYCILYVMLKQPKIINYSLNSSFWTDLLFLKILKLFSKAKIIVTCHDVVPFSKDETDKKKQMRYRQEIFTFADYLLVHNQNSIVDLEKYYGIKMSKILFHSFPIMDLEKILLHEKTCNKIYDFAFIGHLRNEKGLDLLIDTWKLYHDEQPEATLVIAGNAPFKMPILDGIEKLNVDLKLKFLNDVEYFDLIQSTGTIILPYIEGTNSGVVYNLVNLDVNIIYSDLDMFKFNPLLNQEGMFERKNIQQLLQKLRFFYKKENIAKENVFSYRQNFNKEVIKAYSKALKNQ